MKVESRAPGVRLVAMEAVGENQAHLPFPAVSISTPVSDQTSILVYHSRIPQCTRQDYEVAIDAHCQIPLKGKTTTYRILSSIMFIEL